MPQEAEFVVEERIQQVCWTTTKKRNKVILKICRS